MINDWQKLTETLGGFFPEKERKRARKIGDKINSVIAGFLRGQVGVSMLSAVYYSVTLSLVGMEQAILIGIVAGLTIFIPYVGLVIALSVTVGMAIYQFQSFIMVGLVVVIFAIGQLLEDYVFLPRLVGKNIQIHPVLTVFAIMAGGSLLGMPGLIIGAPVAGIIAVFIREFSDKK